MTVTLRRFIGLLYFLSLYSISLKPMYDTNLTQTPCTIRSADLQSCTILSCGCSLYNINLGATSTTILSIWGVTIPINLVSSATDSIRQSVVLFKPVTVPTLDPKSEFLCQLSLIAQNLQTPWTTLYAWDISHTLITTYHPYCHSPSALTEYLKQKLCTQHAKHLGHSLPAQVEPNVPLEHNN